MVTLVNVDLFAQSLLGDDDRGAVFVLLRFLIALPIGALIGGYAAARFGDRIVSIIGMVIAGLGYWLMSGWTVDVLSSPHPLGLPRLDTDLAVAGFGLGLVIAPLSAAALRVVPAERHGVASAGVVVARMTGMLVGVAGLSAWGLHRFHSLTANLNAPLPFGMDESVFEREMAAYLVKFKEALVTQYTDIFLITSIVCVAGAALALLITGKGLVPDGH
jgi:MFS family permease